MNSDFNELQQQAAQIANRWTNHDTDKSNKGTVCDIINRIRAAHIFMQNERKDYERHLQKLDATYRENILAKPKLEAKAEFDKAVATIQKNIKAEISEFIDRKDENISKMVSKAPSEERLRLLQTLNLRDGISKVELMRHVPAAQGNFQELMVLQSIARKNGYRLYLPHQMDLGELATGLVGLKELLFRATAEIGKSYEGTDIAYKSFFYEGELAPGNPTADPRIPFYVRLFDDLPPLNEIELTASNELSKSEAAMLDLIFNGIGEDPKDLNTISKTLKIMDEHPAAVPLMRMSDKYSKYVSEAEAVRAKMEGNE